VAIAFGALIVISVVGAALSDDPDPTPAAAPATTSEAAPAEQAPSPTSEPAAPPPAVAAPTQRDISRIDADTALTDQQKREYLRALNAAVPSTHERLDRHGGDVDTAARYVARDGVRLCQSIAAGESDEVVTRQAALRFDVAESDGPGIRQVTEEQVCSVLT
jgi:hypothetical protein